MESLRLERWASGKVAVQAIKDIALQQGKRAVVAKKGGTFRLLECDSASTGCEWNVRLARFRSKTGPGDWHVTDGNLEHQNCVGVAKPTKIQLVASSVVRAAISAEPSTSTRALVAQLQHQSKVTASTHVMYRAKDAVMSEIFSEDPMTSSFCPVCCRNLSASMLGRERKSSATKRVASVVLSLFSIQHGSLGARLCSVLMRPT